MDSLDLAVWVGLGEDRAAGSSDPARTGIKGALDPAGTRKEGGLELVVVDADPELPVQADGEFLGKPPVEVRVAPGAVRVVVPESREGARAVLQGRLFDES